jgi:hypothetical protein
MGVASVSGTTPRFLGLAAVTFSSIIVFHSPQSGHLPIQREKLLPQAEQTYMVLSFDFVFIAAPLEGHVGIGRVRAHCVTVLEPDVLVDECQPNSTGRTITLFGYDDLRKFLLVSAFQLFALLFAQFVC